MYCSLHFPHLMFVIVSPQTLYDASYIAVYNVIYTSLPVIVLSILDQVHMHVCVHVHVYFIIPSVSRM